MCVGQRALLLLAGLAGLFSSTAANAGCEPQPGFDLPITVADGVPLVRLSVENKEAVLIVDTGAERTLLSTAAAERLQLSRSMVYPRRVRGLNGGTVGGAVELPGLSAGGTRLKSYGALVASIDLPKIGGLSPDGLLGADILSDFDVDIDLSHGRVRLACATGEPVWTQAQTAMAANRSIHDRLFFRAELDGKSIAVIIDTGAQHSVIDRQTALSIGVDPRALNGAPASSVRGIASGTGIEARQYRFRRLTIGRKMVVDPTLLIAPLGLEDADLILGTDFLKAHHVWMSYKSQKIVIARSNASGP